MANRGGVHVVYQYLFQPAQHTELGFRITETIEHHDTQQPLGIELALAALHPPEGLIQAELLPERGQQPGITNGTRRREVGLAGTFFECRLAGYAQQAVDQRAGFSGRDGFQATQRGDHVLARFSGLVAVGLDELHVAARTGFGDFDEHVITIDRMLHDWQGSKNKTCHYKEFGRKWLSVELGNHAPNCQGNLVSWI